MSLRVSLAQGTATFSMERTAPTERLLSHRGAAASQASPILARSCVSSSQCSLDCALSIPSSPHTPHPQPHGLSMSMSVILAKCPQALPTLPALLVAQAAWPLLPHKARAVPVGEDRPPGLAQDFPPQHVGIWAGELSIGPARALWLDWSAASRHLL